MGSHQRRSAKARREAEPPARITQPPAELALRLGVRGAADLRHHRYQHLADQRSGAQRRPCGAATSSTATAARGSGARGSGVAGGYGGQQRSWPTVNKRPQPPRGPNSYSNPRSATTHGGGSEGSAPRANTAARGEADRKPASSTNQLVEVAGIEPASFGTSPGLLRVQPALVSQPRRSRRQAADGLSRCALSWSAPRPS